MNARKISREYKWSKTQVLKYVNEYKRTEKFVNKMSQTGRKKKTSKITDRFIVRSIRGAPEKRRKSSSEIESKLDAVGIKSSPRTIHRRLQTDGYLARIPRKKIHFLEW